MVNGWMVMNFPLPWVPTPPYARPADWMKYKYLDAVHMDITFGDCLLVGGFRYVLILVDQATRHNLAFGLKNLLSDAILSAIRLFCSATGSLAWCIYCNCDVKFFGIWHHNQGISHQQPVQGSPRLSQMAIVQWVS
jgi:hypothetical protein